MKASESIILEIKWYKVKLDSDKGLFPIWILVELI
jgi:hypothetical protein